MTMQLSPEVVSALVGAVLGAVLSFGGTFASMRWQLKADEKRRVEQARVDLVRELMRNRGGGPLHLPMNEVPIMFADDPEALRLCRELRQRLESGGQWDDLLASLIQHLASEVGMGNRLSADDIKSLVWQGRSEPVTDGH